MAYGILKCDTVTFTDGGVDKSVSISGLVQNPTFSGNITVTGTVSGNTIQGQTVSGVTVTGTTANFASGVFTTQISGATVTGNVGSFTTITGGTVTLTSGVFGAGSAAAPSIAFSGDTNTGIYSPGADQVAISTNGTRRLIILSDGKVGLGAASVLQQGSGVDGGSGAGILELYNGGTGNTTLENTGAFPILFKTSGTERLRITSAGLVGVGTSSPVSGAQLTVAGSALAVTGQNLDHSANSIRIGQEGSGAAQIRCYGPNTSTNGSLTFKMSRSDGTNSQDVVIDGSGRLGVGTTSPAEKLHVVGDGVRIDRVGGDPYIDFYTSGSANNVQLYGGASTGFRAFVGGNERLRITSAGLVGIGSSSPSNALTVQSTSRPQLHVSYNGNGGIYLTSANDVARTNWQIASSETTSNTLQIYPSDSVGGTTFTTPAVTIDASRRVGIGTSSVGELLHLNGASAALQIQDSGATNSIGKIINSSGILYIQSQNNTSHGQIAFRTSDGSATERARIDSSGRLLIGTSSAVGGYSLQIEQNAGSAPFDGSILLRRGINNASILADYNIGTIAGGSNTNVGGLIQFVSDAAWGTNDYPTRLVFSTTADGASSPTERMRITQDGDVFINHNSSTSPVVGGEKLGVVGAGNIAIAANTSTNTTPTLFVSNTSDTNNAYVARFSTGSGGNTRGEIYYNGSQLVYATSSDYRLKENVASFDDGIEIVKQLRPVRYNWIENGNEDIGFIAHEVQAVFPNAVGGEKDAVDDNGKILPQTYDPSKLVPLLTAALQEAIGEIESLKARVAALESA